MALLLALPAAAQETWKDQPIPRFGGLDTYHLSNAEDMRDVDAQDAENVLTDSGALEKRGGSVRIATILDGYAVKMVAEFVAPDGTRYVVAHSSLSVYRTDLSGAVTKIGTVTVNQDLDMVVAFGKAIYADGSQALWYDDGTSTASIAGSPACKYLEFDKERIYCANIASESTSLLRVSSFGGVGYWTVPADVAEVADAPNSFNFQKDDGEGISCLKKTPFGMFIGKRRSTHALKGNDNLTYYKRIIDPNIGCVDDRTVQMVDGFVVWLALDGIYAYSGAGQPQLLSRKIEPLVKRIRQLDSAVAEWVVNTTAEFEAGNLTGAGPGAPLTTTIEAGSIQPSSVTLTAGTTAELALGTCEGCGLDGRGQMALAGVTSTYTYRYEGNVLPASDGWTLLSSENGSVSGGSLTINGNYLAFRTLNLTSGSNKHLVFRAASNAPAGGSVGLYIGFRNDLTGSDSNACSISITTFVAYGFTNVHESYTANTYSTFTIILSSANNAVSFWRNGVFKSSKTVSGATGCDTADRVRIENIDSGPTFGFIDFIYTSTGVLSPGTSDIVSVATFTSSIYDTIFSTPVLSFQASSHTAATLSFSARVSTSGNNDLWNDYLKLSNLGPWPSTHTKQYAQYRATMSHTNLVEAPSFSSVVVLAATTATYRSEVHFISEINEWGQFIANDETVGGGTITYYVRAATGAFTIDSATPAWVTQTNRATISASTGNYAQWRGDFILTAPSDTAKNTRTSIAWSEGASNRAASGYKDHRYVLCVTISSTASTNDTCLILQKNTEWTKMTGISVGSMALYNNDIIGGSGTDNSYVYKLLQDDVYQDDGEAISAFWISKDFHYGDPFANKELYEIWVDGAYETSLSTLTVGFAVNMSTSAAYTSKTIQLMQDDGMVNEIITLDDGYKTGRFLRFKFSNAVIDQKFRINAYTSSVQIDPRRRD